MSANNKKKVTVDLTSLTEGDADTFLGALDTLLGTYSLARDDAEPAHSEYADNAGIWKVLSAKRNRLLVACDHSCDKAWGKMSRTQEEGSYHSDGELDTAPDDPGTRIRGASKPAHLFECFNWWCRTECERCVEVSFWRADVPPQFPDFSARVPISDLLG